MDLAKIKGKLPTGFADEADAMDEAALRDVIIDAETTISETEAEKKKDEKLAGARQIVKDLSAGYSDVNKAQRAKIAYALHRLDEIGKGGHSL